jgi:hypothetical protein
MTSFVVFTPGRTGSQLIFKNLLQHFGKNSAVHCHNPLSKPTTDNSWAIVCLLRDVFSAIVSSLVGKRTKEYTQYQGEYNTRFSVDQIEFEDTYQHHKLFYQAIEHYNFVKVIDIYYEDLISDPKSLFASLGIEKDIDLTLQEKSPYKNKELLINLAQCQQWFDYLDSQTIPDSQLDLYRSGIEQDLELIKNNETNFQ